MGRDRCSGLGAAASISSGRDGNIGIGRGFYEVVPDLGDMSSEAKGMCMYKFSVSIGGVGNRVVNLATKMVVEVRAVRRALLTILARCCDSTGVAPCG